MLFKYVVMNKNYSCYFVLYVVFFFSVLIYFVMIGNLIKLLCLFSLFFEIIFLIFVYLILIFLYKIFFVLILFIVLYISFRLVCGSLFIM